MKTKLYEIECSNCESKWMIQADSLVNGEIEKNLKSKLLERSYFNRKCSKCGKIISFYFPFIYQDPKSKTLICLDIDANLEGYKIVSVEDEDTLIEMITILDNHEDIDNIFTIKTFLKGRYEELRFVNSDRDSYVFETSKGIIVINK